MLLLFYHTNQRNFCQPLKKFKYSKTPPNLSPSKKKCKKSKITKQINSFQQDRNSSEFSILYETEKLYM